jgi:hypothetical protein
MSDGDAPGGELPSEFEAALKKLETLFAGALGDAKGRSCGAAWTEIKHAKTAKKKTQILDEKAQQWREDSVKAIRQWFPKFVDLGAAFDEALHGDALHWATDRVWGMVEKQCGITRQRHSARHVIESPSPTMVYWFAMACEGDSEINWPSPRPWKVPRWVAQDARESDSLLKEHAHHLWLRISHVIDEEVDLAEIQRTSKRKIEEQKAEPKSAKPRAYQSRSASRRRRSIDERKKLIAELKVRHPGVLARGICELIDKRIDSTPALKFVFAPLQSWGKKAPGERTWVGLYDNDETSNLVRSYVNKVPTLQTAAKSSK